MADRNVLINSHWHGLHQIHTDEMGVS